MADYTLTHTYQSGCPVAIVKAVAGDQIAMARVDLTGCPDTITAEVNASPDDDTGRTAVLTWDNTGFGDVTIQWDADAPLTGQPETGSTQKIYTEGEDGPHTVIVTDADDVTRRVVVQFSTPLEGGGGLDAYVEVDPSDPTGYTARVVWNAGGTGDEFMANVDADPSDPSGYTARVTWDATTDQGGNQ